MRTTHGGPSGKHKKQPWNPQFISIDGEGYDIDGVHSYTLLMASTGEQVSDECHGISSSLCFWYLLGLSQKYPKHKLVCFAASYDVNMMLKDVPRENIIQLHQTSKTTFRRDNYFWYLEYLPNKSFTVSVWDKEAKLGSATLYDVFGYFQSKFTATCKAWLGTDYPDLETIVQMKAERPEFTAGRFGEIQSYCAMELKALDEIMVQFREALKTAEIYPPKFIGAGSIATYLFQKHKTKQHMEDTREKWPEVYQAARHAFSGGRIELYQYGNTEDTIYHYDLKSAYPSVIRELPSLKDAIWYHSRYLPVSEFSICHIKWKAYHKQNIYPFFFRNKQGYIYYPSYGEGWYWYPEVTAAEKYFKGSIIHLESWCLSLKGPAFDWVEPLYEKRAELKAAGNPAEYPMKLGLNSLYGKMIQHVGGDKEKNKLPSYHQLEWAGYVTACTRAKLYEAMMQEPDSVIMAMTDGIYSTVPLNLDLGERLGQWEEKTHKYGTFVQAGVYFIEGEPDRYRGFDEGSLSRAGIRAAWERGERYISADATRFITIGTASNSDSGWRKWRSWPTVQRKLSLFPDAGKREEGKNGAGQPWKELVSTEARSMFPKGDMSEPYQLPWDTWASGIEVDGVPERVFEQEMAMTQEYEL